MNSFDKLSPQAMEALTSAGSDANKLLGEIAVEDLMAPKKTEQYEDLPYEYRKLHEQIYVETFDAVAKSIRQASLDRKYDLPLFENFEESWLALHPYYEAFQDKGWDPSLIFVPQNLDKDEWSKLLYGFVTKDEGISQGLNTQSIKEVYFVKTKKQLWDVAVISNKRQPIFTNISPDGRTKTPKIGEVLDTLSELPGSKGVPNPNDILKLSPSLDAYLGLQYDRMSSRSNPVDVVLSNYPGRTMINFRFSDYTDEFVLFGNWNSKTCKVDLQGLTRTGFEREIGLRPTVLAGDLLK